MKKARLHNDLAHKEIFMFGSRYKSVLQKAIAIPAPRAPFAAWTSDMSVEVKLLDNDHKKLLILLGELHDGVFHGCAHSTLEIIFESLIRNLRAHFSHEEQFFTETAYPGAAAHEREHDHLIERFRVLQVRLRSCADLNSSLQVIDLLRNCLFNHIANSDQEYAPHLRTHEVGEILTADEVQRTALARKRILGHGILQGAW